MELRYGYRSPGQVLELASRLLPEAAPDVTPTLAVRPGRSAPRLLSVGAGDLLSAVVAEAVGLAGAWPTVAVIVPGDLVDAIVSVLRASPTLPEVGEAVADGLGRPVTVVAAQAAKGLEFDAVLVVEPARITRERSQPASGLRLLYVALTRPTQHLSVISSEPLPAALVAA